MTDNAKKLIMQIDSLFESWRFSGNVDRAFVSFNEILYPGLLELKPFSDERISDDRRKAV